MVRPCKTRNIEQEVEYTCFKPAWVPKSKLERVELLAAELEALRLFNLENLNQQQASEKMQISPSTFNRLIKSANKKITDALVNGKGIRIYKTDGTHNCK
jgi:predicted DNA-binding protein (UPF0251 family)